MQANLCLLWQVALCLAFLLPLGLDVFMQSMQPCLQRGALERNTSRNEEVKTNILTTSVRAGSEVPEKSFAGLMNLSMPGQSVLCHACYAAKSSLQGSEVC